jgi:hypothetical protein
VHVRFIYVPRNFVFLKLLIPRSSSPTNSSSSKNILITSDAAKTYLPQPNPRKNVHISMAIELAYSAISSSTKELLSYMSNAGQSLAADGAIEIAVSIINNRTDILPNIFVDILRARADLWGKLILKKTIREGIFFKVCA